MQKIKINNFKQIRDAEIEISKFVCLIGEQASGKSTIAKLIYFFKSLKAEYLKIFYEADQETEPKDIRSSFIHLIKTKFLEYFGVITQLNDFEVTYYTSVEKRYYIRLRKGPTGNLNINFSRNYWNIFEDKLKKLLAELKQSYRQKTSNYLLQSRINQMVVQKISNFANSLFCDDREIIFFPSGRCMITMLNSRLLEIISNYNYGSHLDSVSKIFSNTMRRSIDLTLVREYIGYIDSVKSKMESLDCEGLPAIFQHHIEKILKGRYLNEDGKERIYYDEEHFIPLNLASSGQQDVINIVIDIIDIFKDNLHANRIIEEPETHLFPTAQRFLIEIMVALCNYRDCTYIITTHSPFVLASINNILFYNTISNTKKREKNIDYFGTKDSAMELDNAFRLDIKDVKAYNISTETDKQYCTSLIDNQTGLIGSNLLDESSESIYSIFERLYENSF